MNIFNMVEVENFEKLSSAMDSLFANYGFVQRKQNGLYCKSYVNNKLSFKIAVNYINGKYPFVKITYFPYSYEDTHIDRFYFNEIHINQVKRDFRKEIFKHRVYLQGGSKNLKSQLFSIENNQNKESIIVNLGPVFEKINKTENVCINWISKIKSFFS